MDDLIKEECGKTLPSMRCGRLLISARNCVEVGRINKIFYVGNSKESLIKVPRITVGHRESKILNKFKKKQEKEKQFSEWHEKALHGMFPKLVAQNNPWDMFIDVESLLATAQDQTVED